MLNSGYLLTESFWDAPHGLLKCFSLGQDGRKAFLRTTEHRELNVPVHYVIVYGRITPHLKAKIGCVWYQKADQAISVGHCKLFNVRTDAILPETRSHRGVVGLDLSRN